MDFVLHYIVEGFLWLYQRITPSTLYISFMTCVFAELMVKFVSVLGKEVKVAKKLHPLPQLDILLGLSDRMKEQLKEHHIETTEQLVAYYMLYGSKHTRKLCTDPMFENTIGWLEIQKERITMSLRV